MTRASQTEQTLELAAIDRWLACQSGIITERSWDGHNLALSRGNGVEIIDRCQLLDAGCRLERGYSVRDLLEELAGKQAAKAEQPEREAKELDRLRRVAKEIYSQGGDTGTKAETAGAGRRLSGHVRRSSVGGRRRAAALATSQTPGVAIKAATR